MAVRPTAMDSILKRCHSCIGVAASVIAFVAGSTAIARAQGNNLNEWCPVMKDEKIDPAMTVEYRGKTVAFCCDTCVKKFKANPAKYEKTPSPVAGAVSATVGGPERRTGHDHSGSGSLGDGRDSALAALPDSADQHGHDHGTQESDDERELILGRLHPIVIHFPIAGMPLAMLGFLVWVRSGREVFARSDVIPLFAATLASIAAVITGNIAHDSMRFSESLHVVVERHQFVSTTIMVIAIFLSIIRLWRWNGLIGKWRWMYGGGLAIVCALLGYTGFLGGSLVFGPSHLAW